MAVVGVNLKLYLGYAETLAWCARVAEIAATHPAVARGDIRVFVLPSAPALAAAREVLAPAGVLVGAQNVHWDGPGAFTGEVDVAMLAELGCELVAIGHAERRDLFGETDRDVARKVAAAAGQGLVPLVCIGEHDALAPDAAAGACSAQLDRALADAHDLRTPVLVAYEPVWAIGAEQPASVHHVRRVCAQLQAHAASVLGPERFSLLYGGSAGPGLWSGVGGVLDGLFLGRRAHDPAGLARVLDEIAAPLVPAGHPT